MRTTGLILSAVLLGAAGICLAQQAKDKPQSSASAPIPAEASAMKNPVKPTPDGLAEARKLFGYHCAMCHGKDGDGKGDLGVQMKLDLKDWRDPSTIAHYTDGDLFYIITNGRGKMEGGEGDRTKAEIRWNLVNLVRSFGTKAGPEPAK